ncbi:sigma-70 family RNA polymerase sigma factor [Candidatus Saccharibacteria bacterium]|nr:sigma-70 family RNA polymerase sigma factor [Candidatus Saccharibacteria bacterium]
MALSLELAETGRGSEWLGDDVYKIYLEEVKNIDLLEDEETDRLTRTIYDCRQQLDREREKPQLTAEQLAGLEKRLAEAFRKMVEANQQLVIKFAIPFTKWTEHLKLPDLIQAGNKGLMRAIWKFIPEKGFRFSTYAVIWIRQAIFREVDGTDRAIHVPGNVISNSRSLDIFRKVMSELMGRWLNDEEVAERRGIDVADVKDFAAIDDLSRNLGSLDKPVKPDDEGALLIDLITDPNAANPEEIALETVDRERRKADMNRLLGQLEPLEQEILRRKFGFADEPLPIADIGRELGLTENVVQRTARTAVSKLLRLLHGQPVSGGQSSVPTGAEAWRALPDVIEFDYENGTAMTEVTLGKLVVRVAAEEQPPTNTEWLWQGSCLPFNLEIFYPGDGHPPAAARTVCLECEVKTPCLEYALASKHPGTWGVTTIRDRRKINSRRQQLQITPDSGRAEGR